jgi:D-alanyl-D-alanine-carboxypeptidase/D-alanyl-D-alanine-endopeptidase
MIVRLLCLVAALASVPAFARSDEELRAALERRLKDDRTGACIAAAVIEDGATARAWVCADATSPRRFDANTAFEIGSVSKTMTAALLGEFVARGEIALDDPLTKLLPPGTVVPSFNGTAITVAHVITHTSGLPLFPWKGKGMTDPYARISEAELIDALAATQLTRAPGAQYEYSNFAFMVLSWALARRSGMDFETLLRERLLQPLGMNDSYIATRPPHVRPAEGHFSNTLAARPWNFHVDMAGVGGVRATLPDMVRYVEGQLGMRESAITPALARTQEQVAEIGRLRMGMAWFIQTTAINANSHTIPAHAGGTGGFSTFVAFDRAAKRGVILLSDTALTDLGGLGQFAMHLFDSSQPAGAPRTAAVAGDTLLNALTGRYRMSFGLGMDVRRKGNVLTIQADGQPEFEMAYDSAGDFYPLKFDALMKPKLQGDGTYAFSWHQLGGVHQAERVR